MKSAPNSRLATYSSQQGGRRRPNHCCTRLFTRPVTGAFVQICIKRLRTSSVGYGLPDALVHIEQALQLDPDRTALESDRAALFEELHRFNDAQAAYIRILDREPANSRAHYAYNGLLYRLGKKRIPRLL